jgi:DNA repair exonuclease SbcCD ATPase subunit
VDLLTIARELYRAPLADFTAARNARAKDVSSAGDRALAAQVRQLPKPSASAWAVNRLVVDSESLSEQFESLGSQLREAQSNADRASLTALIKSRRTLVAQSTKAAGELARRDGIRLSAAALEEVEASLQAALADRDGTAAVFSGRLVRPIESDGLEPVDLAGAVGGPDLASHAPHKASSQAKRTAAARDASASNASRAAAVRAARAATKADTAVAEVERRLAELDTARERLARDIQSLQAQFDELQDRQDELDGQAKSLNREHTKAVDASRLAHEAAGSPAPRDRSTGPLR